MKIEKQFNISDNMYENLYKTIKKQNHDSSIQYMRQIGKIDDDMKNEDIEFVRNKNFDLMKILKLAGAIKETSENLRIIDEYSEKLYKSGLKIGVIQGKKLVINVIKNNKVKIDKLLEYPTENLTKIKIEPEYLMNYEKKLWHKDQRKLTSAKDIRELDFSEKIDEIIFDLKEEQLKILYDELKIDKKGLKNIQKKILTLRYKSSQYPFCSNLFRSQKGRWKIQTLLHKYHEDTLKESIYYGMQYGKKIIIEDLQNKRLNGQYINNMDANEVKNYCTEIRDDIKF